jgi:hypothetical protein
MDVVLHPGDALVGIEQVDDRKVHGGDRTSFALPV